MASEWKMAEVAPETVSPHDPRVRGALRLIQNEFKDHDLTVANLAQKLGLSPSRLRQLFASELGSTPKSYIREIRLARARTLLEHSGLSIKEVMAAVGFNDPSHFSKDYKRRFGLMPSKYRESFCGGEDDASSD
jgi:transcriptional regulator GlxA family with amidase domain